MFYFQDVIVAFLCIIAVILLSSFLPRLALSFKYRRLPPGPFCWPILGYVPFLDRTNVHLKLKQEAEKYGGIFSLYLGSRLLVIIDDFEILKKAYSSEEFLGRPEGAMRINLDDRQIAVADTSGKQWKFHRKLWVNAMRYLTSKSHGLNAITTDLIDSAVREVKKTQEVNLEHFLELAIHNVIFFNCFGKMFDENHEMIKQLGVFDEAQKAITNLNGLGVFFPWAYHVVGLLPKFRRILKETGRMDELINEELEEHQRALDENNPRDFTDHFLIKMRETENEDFTLPMLAGNIKVFLVTASDSTRISLVWFFLLMAKYPEIQEEIQQEIDNVVGRERLPQLEDKTSLPLLEASILESMRLKNITNLNLPRRVLWDTTLCGYDVPKDTVVFQNMGSHFHNPKYWSHPDKFDPYRFLSPDRKSVQTSEHYIPFSYGRRLCLGEKIAKSTVFLFAASLIQKFKTLPPDGGVNLNVRVNFLNSAEHPFVRFVVR